MAKHRAEGKPPMHRRLGNRPLQHSFVVPPSEPAAVDLLPRVPLEKLPLSEPVTPVPSKAHLGSRS